jgi:hypothetical protein
MCSTEVQHSGAPLRSRLSAKIASPKALLLPSQDPARPASALWGHPNLPKHSDRLLPICRAGAQMHEIARTKFTEYADKVRADPGKAIATKGDYIAVAGRLFNRAQARDERIPGMSTKDLEPKRERPDYLDRAAFTMAEWGCCSPTRQRYRTTELHRFLATVVPAFTGCAWRNSRKLIWTLF